MHTNDSQSYSPPPVQVGHYLINREIGRGGMGEVFLAFDPICGRDIALKRMHQHLKALANVRKRFLKEAQIASLLSHPSIIPIYSINKEGSDIFYTMPFVEGETIKDLLTKTASEEAESVQKHIVGHSIPALIHIYLQICQAIASAHAKGFIHRDLKAENVILGKYGEVLILDWGLAEIGRAHV